MPEFLEATVDKFTFRVATDRLYAREGLWISLIQPERETRVRVGVTDFFQMHGGDVTFITTRPVGTMLQTGSDLADFETMKTSMVLASPVSGEIVAVNDALELNPELVNQSPYEKGWLAEIRATSWDVERVSLLDARAYLDVMLSQVQEELERT